MAQIVDNWADVTGLIREIDPVAAPSRFASVRLVVARVDPVEGSPNLLADRSGTLLEIQVPSAAVSADLHPGTVVRCRVRMAANGAVFARPNGVEVQG